MTAAEILADLRRCRFNYVTERDLQDLIAARLNVDESQREVRLNARDRIDFLIDGVGIEVKIAGARALVIEQLHRYAHCPEVESLILVTNRCRHCAIEATMNGKSVELLLMGGVF